MSKEKQPVPINFYYAMVRCNNCELYQEVEINYGTLIRHKECPNCKCKELEKTHRKTNY